jgi:polyisoprenyl-teichoic acid--peptidoglycan teichoic acid transferase
MKCREARPLLDSGVRPGSREPIRARLGFHLAQCPSCRAYQQDPQAQLLRELLAEPVADVPARRRRPPWQWQQQPAWRTGLLALAALLVMAFGYLLGSIGVALFTIQRNVQAMRVPTAQISAVSVDRAQITAIAPTPIDPALLNLPASSSVSTATITPMSQPADRAIQVPEHIGSGRAHTPSSPPAGGMAATTLPGAAERPLEIAPRTPVPTLRPTVDIDPALLDPPAADRALTVLLLGIDQRPDEPYPSRTDAIALAHIDPQNQRVALLSLPRDLIVEVPGFGYSRINAASVYGELNPQTGGGVALTRRTVSNLLNVPIDYVVHINFSGFIGAIDALGGVTINVEKEIYDPAYPTMNYGYTVAHFLPGPQAMDGATALMYARVRHPDSDFERMRRQQQVMIAALARLREQNSLFQIHSVAAITSAMRDYVQTDMPQDQMISLAWAFRDFSPADVERYTLDAGMVSMNVVPGDPFAQIAAPGAIRSLSRLLIHGPVPR